MNIHRKPVRNTGLIVLTFMLAFTLFSGSFLVKSLHGGMISLSNRLGADIIVVPQGYDSNIQGALLRGEPNTFYFDIGAVDKIRKIEGVEQASPQLFIATLSAGCCSFPLQVIGIDFASDFNIKPWLEQHILLPLKENYIVTGCNIVGDVHSQVRFFNQPFTIACRLSKTGMGFDNSVFMTLENARKLAREYERMMRHPVAQEENLVSSVMVKVIPGVNPRTVANRIRKAFTGEQIYPLVSKHMMSNISGNISRMTRYIYLLMVLLWLLSFIVLAVSFSTLFNERKAEFGMLRILGSVRSKLALLAATEACIISTIGSAVGSISAAAIMLLFNQAIIQKINMPFLNPSPAWTIMLFTSTFLLISAAGPLSSLKTVYGFSRKDPALAIREDT